MDWITLGLYVVLGCVMFFVWTTVHEASHAVCILASGGKIVRFIPWPHVSNGKHFIGRVVWYPPRGLTQTQNSIINVAPLIIDACVILTLVPFVLMSGTSYGILNVVCIASIIDALAFMYNGLFLTGREFTDIHDFIRSSKLMSLKALRIVSAVMVMLLIVLLVIVISFCVFLPNLS